MIEKIDSNLNIVDKKIEEFSLQLNSPILAIPGISHISAMSILSELGDFTQYESAKKIIKLSGTNPYIYESGTYRLPLYLPYRLSFFFYSTFLSQYFNSFKGSLQSEITK